MDPIIGGALISGASSLLGGLFGGSKQQYVVPDYAKIRRRAEKAGFNPLTALTSAPGQVVTSQNYMGSAIADAGLLLADGMVKTAERDGEVAKLKEQNEKLIEKLRDATLRPRVGGIYAQTESTPSLRQALGGKDVLADRLHDPVALEAGGSGGIAVPDPRLDRGTGFYINGHRLEAAPGWSPASVAEDEYGDVGQAFYGVGKFFADAAYTHSLHRSPGVTKGQPLSLDAVRRDFSERDRQRLRERLKRGEKLTPAEMIAAGH